MPSIYAEPDNIGILWSFIFYLKAYAMYAFLFLYQGYKTGMAKLSFAYGRNMTLVYLFNFDFLFILHIHKFVLKKNEENF